MITERSPASVGQNGRMIRKPVEMNFDPDGKLWVVSSSTYPQLKPGQDPDDKVIHGNVAVPGQSGTH